MNLLINAFEDLFNLLVQFVPVGNYKHSGILNIFPYPLGQPDHNHAFTASLRMPDDTAFPLPYTFLQCFNPEILIVTAYFLNSGIEHYEVMNKFQKSLFIAHLKQMAVK